MIFLKKQKYILISKMLFNKYDIVYASSARQRDINKKHLSFKNLLKSKKKNKKRKLELYLALRLQVYLMMI